MRNRKWIVRRAMLLGSAALLIGLGVSCFGPFPDHSAVHRLAGTEMASDSRGGLSVSPDDRWLVFSELTTTGLVDWWNLFRVCSLDLVSGKKIAHRLPPEFVGDDRPTFQKIGLWSAASWQNGVYVLDSLAKRGQALVLDPQREVLESAEISIAGMTCSDCPPFELVRDLSWRPSNSGLCSLPWHEGELKEVIYFAGEGVSRVRRGEPKEVVVGKNAKKRLFMDTQFGILRVSPDESYLAYTFNRATLNPFLPARGGNVFVYLKNLKTGREHRLFTGAGVGSLIWSSDSRRLYFTARSTPAWPLDADEIRGVYLVDVADVFPE